jgi:hypothetical protein
MKTQQVWDNLIIKHLQNLTEPLISGRDIIRHKKRANLRLLFFYIY